jgi:glycosyltransferase involved in cell wall biosynthesis
METEMAAAGSGLHPLHRLWRLAPARVRRRALAGAVRLLAPRPDRPAPAAGSGVAIVGELDRHSGLGQSARLMLAAARQLGVPAWGVPLDGLTLRPRGGEAAQVPPSAALLLHVNAPQLPLALRGLPRGMARGRLIIGYWAWELPTVPAGWHFGSEFAHEVWVPSTFTQSALARLLPGHVRCVHLPVAALPPAPTALGRATFGLEADAVITLVSFNLASSFVRKNPLAAVAAHRLAFGDRTDRVLLLKVGNPGDFPQDFRLLQDAVAGAANIRIETRALPPGDNDALTRAADIVLSLHRSEGFGLVMAEAMLLGRPVVATGWSGNMDFMAAGAAALVGYRLVPARDPRGVFEAPGAVWADPDIGEAAGWLRRLADQPALRAEMGAAGRAMAQARLGLQPVRMALAGLGLMP